jgi:hypothetical protein
MQKISTSSGLLSLQSYIAGNPVSLIVLMLASLLITVVNSMVIGDVQYWSLPNGLYSTEGWLPQALPAIDGFARQWFDSTGIMLVVGSLTQTIKILDAIILWVLFQQQREFFERALPWLLFGMLLLIFFPEFSRPPHGDAYTSFFNEGLYLSNTDFDYAGLASQPIWSDGGPLSYLITLYSAVIGITYSVFTDVNDVLLFHHLVSIAAGALVLYLSYRLFQEQFGDNYALYGMLMIFFTPRFGMEMLELSTEVYMLVLLLLSFRNLLDNRVWSAVGWALVFVLIKPVAMLWVSVLFANALVRIAADRRLTIERLAMMVPLILQFSIVIVLALVIDIAVQTNMEGELLVIIKSKLFQVYKILFKTGTAHLIAWAITLLVLWSGWPHIRPFLARWKSIVKNNDIPLVVQVNFVIVAWVILFALVIKWGSAPRYVMVIWPFLIFNIIYFAREHMPAMLARWFLGGLLAFTSVGLGYTHIAYPMVAPFYVYLQQDVARFVETEYPDHTVLTGRPFVQMLAEPAFGYVRQGVSTITMNGTKLTPLGDTVAELTLGEWPEKLLVLYAPRNDMPDHYAFQEVSDRRVQVFAMHGTGVILYTRDFETAPGVVPAADASP